ncbi:hypothetical protein SAM40697_3908 [Streptomyces ambofaciens]|uniref:Uncharacterized protein n=1 Tax=Streptomyces ambofaciens TaxID=1889 RepID=A0ABN4P9A9_STRAM|nr:hypothetical protein [Streptomyces ambofaciens]ANB07866.1 hypothetical protein SAM40697_3908 [Streptomyces ambofaciens]
MSGVSFELHRAASSAQGRKGEIYSWTGEVSGLGRIELSFPTEHSDYPAEYCEVAVNGDSFPLVTYLGLRYLRRPLLARGELRVDWDPADLSRSAYGWGRQGRALRIQIKGRSYTYVQVGGKRSHELTRPGAGVSMRRSSWNHPRTLSGTCSGAADALDIAVAVVLEAVYTRNLSAAGALVSMPGRFLNRCNFL